MNVCKYCKGTKQILLFNAYVECLDCEPINLTKSVSKFIKEFNNEKNIKVEKLSEKYNCIGQSDCGSIGLNHDDCRIIICGQSGCGKTHLVRKYLNTLIKRNATVSNEKDKYKILIIDSEAEYIEYPEINSNVKNINKYVTNLYDTNFGEKVYSTLEESFRSNDILLFSEYGEQLSIMKIITELNFQFLELLRNRYLKYKFLYIHDHLINTKSTLDLSNRDSITSYKNSLKDLEQRGRNYGLSTILVTQRLSRVHWDIIAECNNFLTGKTNIETDMKRNSEFINLHSAKKQTIFKSLNKEFIASGDSFNFDPTNQYIIIKSN